MVVPHRPFPRPSPIADLVNGLVGLPYSRDGRGPAAWNCWHLCRHVSAAGFGLELPEYAAAESDAETARLILGARASGAWIPIGIQLGAIAALGRGRFPAHVGIVVLPGRVLHAVEARGVVVDSLARLALEWRHREFWRYEPLATSGEIG